MKKKTIIFLSVCIIFSISVYRSFAEVPCNINYQGRLIKDNVPVHNTTGVPMTFTVDGIQVYSGNIPVYNGLFRVVLDLEGIDWTAGEEKSLEVTVDGELLSPPEPIYAYPYAINSHLLEGRTTAYFLNVSGSTQTKKGGLNIEGNVGIGTTSPSGKLEISHDGISKDFVVDSETGYIGMGVSPEVNYRLSVRQFDSGMSGIYSESDTVGVWGFGGTIGVKGFTITPDAWAGSFSGGKGVYADSISIGYTDTDAGDDNMIVQGNVGIGTTEPEATLEVKGTMKVFGGWETKSYGTVYQAATDGFVCAYSSQLDASEELIGYTDGNNPPTTIRLRSTCDYGASRPREAIMMPIRKGDYWRITISAGESATVYWIPFGSQ